MNEPISRWSNTQAIREVACPRCGAEAGKGCTQPSGKRCVLHVERSKAYLDRIGRAEWDRRHSMRVR